MKNKMDNKQLPETAEYLNKMEEIFNKIAINFEEYDYMGKEDKRILMNPMFYLAEAICEDTNSMRGVEDSWAVELANYIYAICGIKHIVLYKNNRKK